MFNKPTDLRYDEIMSLPGMRILNQNYENNCWITSKDMTEGKKKAHPEHETTGGYLKGVGFKTACRMMWNKLSNCEKSQVYALPNFDKEIFKEITGIEVDKV